MLVIIVQVLFPLISHLGQAWSMWIYITMFEVLISLGLDWINRLSSGHAQALNIWGGLHSGEDLQSFPQIMQSRVEWGCWCVFSYIPNSINWSLLTILFSDIKRFKRWLEYKKNVKEFIYSTIYWTKESLLHLLFFRIAFALLPPAKKKKKKKE